MLPGGIQSSPRSRSRAGAECWDEVVGERWAGEPSESTSVVVSEMLSLKARVGGFAWTPASVRKGAIIAIGGITGGGERRPEEAWEVGLTQPDEVEEVVAWISRI
jgi:hypothetical protein